MKSQLRAVLVLLPAMEVTSGVLGVVERPDFSLEMTIKREGHIRYMPLITDVSIKYGYSLRD